MSIVTCPECKMRVIASVEGKCPSCRSDLASVILALENAPESEPAEAPPIKLRNGADSPFAPPKTRELQAEQANHFDVLQVLFSFRGRIPRSVFWLASIMGWLAFYILLAFAEALLSEGLQVVGWVALTGFLAMIWMSFAVSVKRLHDLNWTGWSVLLVLIPGLGPILLLFTAGMMRGTIGQNRYGPDPLKLLE